MALPAQWIHALARRLCCRELVHECTVDFDVHSLTDFIISGDLILLSVIGSSFVIIAVNK